jgi:hypothetical protein
LEKLERLIASSRLLNFGDHVTCRIEIHLRHRRTGILLPGHKRQTWTARGCLITALAEVLDADLINAIHRLDSHADPAP